MLIKRRLSQSICQHPRIFENRGFYNCSSIERILNMCLYTSSFMMYGRLEYSRYSVVSCGFWLKIYRMTIGPCSTS